MIRAFLFFAVALPLFFVAPALGVCAFAIWLVSLVPRLLGWALTTTADGLEVIGVVVDAGADVTVEARTACVHSAKVSWAEACEMRSQAAEALRETEAAARAAGVPVE